MDALKHKITVLVEDEEFARFEAYCSRNGYKKSTLICRLIREHMDSERFSVQKSLDFHPARKEEQ